MEQNEVVLEKYVAVAECIQGLFTDAVAIMVADREKFLMYRPSKKQDLKIQPGTLVKPGSAMYQAVREGRRVIIRGDKALYGEAFIAVAMPIYNERREVIGAICADSTPEKQDRLQEMAVQLTDSLSTLASTMEEISAQTEETAALSRLLAKATNESQNRIQETDQVLGLIKSVAGQTNLLGLNAAIEAARVGEMGRGFGVVAEEIRKLASSSADSIKKIEDIVHGIQADGNNIQTQMLQIDGVVAQIADAVSSVAGSLQEMSTMARQLDNMAESLTKDE